MTREMLVGWTNLMQAMVSIIEDELKIVATEGPLLAKDVKAIEESFAMVAALGSAKELGIGFFRL